MSRGILPVAEQVQVVPDTGGLSQVMLLVYFPTLGKSFHIIRCPPNSRHRIYMELPNAFKNQELHFYLAFVADDRKAINEGVYKYPK